MPTRIKCFAAAVPRDLKPSGLLPATVVVRRIAAKTAMPIYEYECEKCRKRTSVLTMRVGEKLDASCRHCGSPKLKRIMSRFAMPRSEEQRLDRLADPSNLGDLDQNDPRSVARMMKKMGSEMGDEFGGSEFDEAMEEMEGGGDLDRDGDDSGDDEL
jgi:putative FmdB family regulatory protein